MPLRFGIVPLEFKPAAERIVVNGTPDFSRFNLIEIVREAVDEGYSVIEVSMDAAHVIPGSLTEKSIQNLADLKDELGHVYTTHLPLWSIELATFNEHVRKASVNSTIEAIKLAEPLEPETYVLHATGSLAAEFSRLNFHKAMVNIICEYMNSFSAKSVEEIITKTEINPRKIAIENIEFPFELTREIVDEYNTSICFDTGHLLTRYSGNESLVEFYTKHKNRIIELHLQDGVYVNRDGAIFHDDHLALGHGEMNIREFLIEIVNDDFKGPIIFELTGSEAKESMEKIRELVPEALQ